MHGIIVKVLWFRQCNFRFNHSERYTWQIDVGHVTVWLELV